MINHLLTGCVFAREVWTITLQQLGLLQLAPQPTNFRFAGWWRRAIAAASKEVRKGLNSLIVSVAWEVWKHHNARVFEKRRPCVHEVLRAVRLEGGLVRLEGGLWCSARASKLRESAARSPTFLA
jgi:hypothetical protein